MKKRTAIVSISVLCAALIAVGAFGVYQSRQLWVARQVQQVYGERAVRELAQSLTALDDALREGGYAADPVLYSRLAMDAAAQSADALDAMSSLPYATHELEKTAQFINGAGDYALSMSRISARAELPDEEARRNMSTVETTIAKLAAKAVEIDAALSDGAVKLDEYGEGADANRTDTVGYELRTMEEELPEYPELKYDGHYAAQSQDDGEGGVTEEEARRAAALFLGIPEQRLISEGKTGGLLPCWGFSISKENDGKEQRIAVTVKDGKVAQWEDTCRPDSGAVPEDEAARRAERFLQKHEYSDMQEVSRATEGGLCTFTFAAVQHGVVCLPDVVSVSVSLETGEPCSFVAEEYIMHHRDRGELIAKVTPEQAAEKLSDTLSPQASRLVIAQTAGGAEIFCHQIVCASQRGETVTVYVNALTGAQEKIIVSQGAEA